MRKNLLLVNPVNPSRTGLAVSRGFHFPPLGLGIVAALTPDDWEIDIIDENLKPFKSVPADLVGLTAFTSAANRAYEIARVYREKGVSTVIGGIHASMLPEEALRYVDAVVIGEAESVWPEVIADFEAGALRRTYRGYLMDMKGMPKPRHDLFRPRYNLGSIQTARGCPMNCEFCSVPVFNGRRYRQRPVEEVLDELEIIPQRGILFVDDNIIGYGERSTERALALFKGMIERGIKKKWICQASLNFADNEEVLEYAARSGCRMVFLGVEAEAGHALEDMNKKLNLSRLGDRYEEIFRRIHKHGISVLGAFIYGADSDTPEALRRRTEYILNGHVDVPQVTFLTALPGTRLFNKLQAEKRLLYTDFPADWDHYQMTEATHRPLTMEAREFADIGRNSCHRIFRLRRILRKFFKTLYATRNITASLLALETNFIFRKVFFGTLKSNPEIPTELPEHKSI